MEIKQTGFILYTINYEACKSFYKDILGLKVIYDKNNICCFDFHGSYLLVELDDETELTNVNPAKRDRTCIRFNVENVKEACQILKINNIPYTYNEFDWGTIAKFRDPDFNLIGFRSAKEHETDSSS